MLAADSEDKGPGNRDLPVWRQSPLQLPPPLPNLDTLPLELAMNILQSADIDTLIAASSISSSMRGAALPCLDAALPCPSELSPQQRRNATADLCFKLLKAGSKGCSAAFKLLASKSSSCGGFLPNKERWIGFILRSAVLGRSTSAVKVAIELAQLWSVNISEGYVDHFIKFGIGASKPIIRLLMDYFVSPPPSTVAWLIDNAPIAEILYGFTPLEMYLQRIAPRQAPQAVAGLLPEAARCEKMHLLPLLLSSGAEANDQDSRGWSALHWAAFQGRLDAVQALLAVSTIQLNAQTIASKSTPLHLAATLQGSTEVLQALLVAGADPQVLSSPLGTAGGEAALPLQFGAPPEVHVAAERFGGDVLPQNGEFGGCRAIEIAAVAGNADAVRLLGLAAKTKLGQQKEAAGEPQSEDMEETAPKEPYGPRWDALKHSIERGWLEVFEALVEAGAKVEGMRDAQGHTPMHWAIRACQNNLLAGGGTQNVAVARAVLRAGAEPLGGEVGELERALDGSPDEQVADFRRLLATEQKEA